MDSQALKLHAHGLHGSVPGHLCICYSCTVDVFVGLAVGTGVSLTILPALGTPFFLLDCLA